MGQAAQRRDVLGWAAQRRAGTGCPVQIAQGVPPYRMLTCPPDFVLLVLSVGGQDGAVSYLPLDAVPEMGTVILAVAETIWLVMTFSLAGCKFVILSVPGHGLLLSGVATCMKSNRIKYGCKKLYKPTILGVTCSRPLAPFSKRSLCYSNTLGRKLSALSSVLYCLYMSF